MKFVPKKTKEKEPSSYKPLYIKESLVKEIEKIAKENYTYLDCTNDNINTTNANGKMISRILTSVSQNEIERTSEIAKIGLVGAIKEGHIPHKAPFGYKRIDKILVPDESTKDDIIRIFNLYHEGSSYQTISNILGKTNWKDSTILKILSNEIYKGDFVHGKITNNPTYYENVVESLISKELWEECQVQKRKNSRNYKRDKDSNDINVILDKYEQDLKNHSNEVKELKKKITTRKDRISDLENRLDFANDTIDMLEDKVDKLQETLNYFKQLREYQCRIN